MKKPEPWPIMRPRPPRGRIPGGMPSGPPKRRKKRSIGESDGSEPSPSSLALAALSPLVALAEITDRFPRYGVLTGELIVRNISGGRPVVAGRNYWADWMKSAIALWFLDCRASLAMTG